LASTKFELLAFSEAIDRLQLSSRFNEYMLEKYSSDGRRVCYYPGSATAENDIDLDGLFWAGEIGGIYAEHDLVISASIWNWEIDTTACFLIVGRDLACRHLIAGCSDIAVGRDLRAEGIVVATYNHGRLDVAQDVYAKQFIVDDHNTRVGGKLIGRGWTDQAGTSIRSSRWLDEIRPEFKSEFFRDDGLMKCPNGNVDLVKALLADRDILKAR
jgi:hypothetical protein